VVSATSATATTTAAATGTCTTAIHTTSAVSAAATATAADTYDDCDCKNTKKKQTPYIHNKTMKRHCQFIVKRPERRVDLTVARTKTLSKNSQAICLGVRKSRC
jgi:hypothetical protein